MSGKLVLPHTPFWANRRAKSLSLVLVFALTVTVTGHFIGFDTAVPEPFRFLGFPLGLWLFVGHAQTPWAVALWISWLLYLGLSAAIVASDKRGHVIGLGICLFLVLAVNVLGNVLGKALSGLR